MNEQKFVLTKQQRTYFAEKLSDLQMNCDILIDTEFIVVATEELEIAQQIIKALYFLGVPESVISGIIDESQVLSNRKIESRNN